MKICPNCGAEYENSVQVCSDCNVTLIIKSEYENLTMQYSDWKEVFASPHLYEAEMVKTNLESAGIDAVIFDQKDSSFPLGGELGEIKVLVPQDKVEEALLIIERIENQDAEEENE